MVRTVQPGVHNRRVSIEPDTKDWTWVVDQPCPDCGCDPSVGLPRAARRLIHENTRGWYDVLADADFAVRPAPHVWSRLEYACHVRDVHAPVRRTGAADARRGRPDLRRTGTRTPPRSSRPTTSRTRPTSGSSWSSVPPRWRRSTPASRASSGSAPVGGATARCSRSRRSGATTCTTWSTTSGTSRITPDRAPAPKSARSRP